MSQGLIPPPSPPCLQHKEGLGGQVLLLLPACSTGIMCRHHPPGAVQHAHAWPCPHAAPTMRLCRGHGSVQEAALGNVHDVEQVVFGERVALADCGFLAEHCEAVSVADGVEVAGDHVVERHTAERDALVGGRAKAEHMVALQLVDELRPQLRLRGRGKGGSWSAERSEGQRASVKWAAAHLDVADNPAGSQRRIQLALKPLLLVVETLCRVMSTIHYSRRRRSVRRLVFDCLTSTEY